MHTIPTSGTPRLLPEELLDLAGDHEHDELERYRGLAFRFLAFSGATSRLMAALGIECEMRLAGLARAARRLGLDEPHSEAAMRLATPAVAPPALIGSLTMARDALSQAMTDAATSRQFYARLGEFGAGSSLGH